MGITFAVDDVPPAAVRLAETNLPITSFAKSAVLGASREELCLVHGGMPQPRTHGSPPGDRLNALAQAVDLAFNEHRPLRLTPDALWITLEQGFSIHVRENAERLRSRFVRHQGRQDLSVGVTAVPSGHEWRDVIARFVEQSAEHLGPDTVALLTRPFSTTGPDEEMVFRVALMDAFKEYFRYEVVLICGIPEVTLDGTADDYRDLKRRVEAIGEHELRFWTDQLLPICDQWIATAEGRPDVEFWKAIHRPEEIYGGHLTTGWLARLFPYVARGGRWVRNQLAPARRIPEDAVKPSHFLESAMRGELRAKAAREGRGEIIPWAVPGISLSEIPPSWSKAEIDGKDFATERRFLVGGGLAGVRQDAGGLALEPVVAWLVEDLPAEASAARRSGRVREAGQDLDRSELGEGSERYSR